MATGHGHSAYRVDCRSASLLRCGSDELVAPDDFASALLLRLEEVSPPAVPALGSRGLCGAVRPLSSGVALAAGSPGALLDMSFAEDGFLRGVDSLFLVLSLGDALLFPAAEDWSAPWLCPVPAFELWPLLELLLSAARVALPTASVAVAALANNVKSNLFIAFS